ncbi:hypothetical protein IMZ48_25765 [Candidatus Bathyarchaeota archaeon]|nr:hypothetical protein [Candidatus Bathyarchaeota archaeon]
MRPDVLRPAPRKGTHHQSCRPPASTALSEEQHQSRRSTSLDRPVGDTEPHTPRPKDPGIDHTRGADSGRAKLVPCQLQVTNYGWRLWRRWGRYHRRACITDMTPERRIADPPAVRPAGLCPVQGLSPLPCQITCARRHANQTGRVCLSTSD